MKRIAPECRFNFSDSAAEQWFGGRGPRGIAKTMRNLCQDFEVGEHGFQI